MTENSNGPWGRGSKGKKNPPDHGSSPSKGRPKKNPEIDDLVRMGRDSLRNIMGGRGGGSGGNEGDQGDMNFGSPRMFIFILLIAFGIWWGFQSIYRVDTSQQSIELIFGKYSKTGGEGLHIAPWPIVTKEVVSVTPERTIDIGFGGITNNESGLMLTGDENIVDIDFQVVWNISDLQKFLFNLAAPQETIKAVSESAMREIIARSKLAPVLNRDRGAIASELEELIQNTLDSYQSGVNIIRVNLDKADPPAEVIDAFREVQAAEQTRDTLEKQADAYANRVLAEARGNAAQILEEAEGYKEATVNEAQGEASRFIAVYNEYEKAKVVTRKRLYIETLERVLSEVDKIIIDNVNQGGQNVLPYLSINELKKNSQSKGASK